MLSIFSNDSVFTLLELVEKDDDEDDSTVGLDIVEGRSSMKSSKSGIGIETGSGEFWNAEPAKKDCGAWDTDFFLSFFLVEDWSSVSDPELEGEDDDFPSVSFGRLDFSVDFLGFFGGFRFFGVHGAEEATATGWLEAFNIAFNASTVDSWDEGSVEDEDDGLETVGVGGAWTWAEPLCPETQSNDFKAFIEASREGVANGYSPCEDTSNILLNTTQIDTKIYRINFF